ncbi:cytochrome oxidase assembly protein 1 [Tanacetum coccineum]
MHGLNGLITQAEQEIKTKEAQVQAMNGVSREEGCLCLKALEKASKSQAVIDAIGEPIARGPWYNASLAVTHKRHSVSCTFPVSGPQGSGIFQLRAVRNAGKKLLHITTYGASPEAYDQLCATIQAEMAKEEAAAQAEETQAVKTQS